MRLSMPIPHAGFRPFNDVDDEVHLTQVAASLEKSKVLNFNFDNAEVVETLYDNLSLFMPQDFQVASRAKWLSQLDRAPLDDSANDQLWLCIGGSQDEDFLVFEGLQAALTYVLDDVMRYVSYPSKVDVTKSRIRFSFDSGLLCKKIVELRLANPNSPTLFPELSRYTGVLTGLAISENPDDTLVKRLSALSGWGSIKLIPYNRTGRKNPGHAPIPKEWRTVGKEFLRKVGIESATSSQVEDLVCAVFGFPTWNHLTAAYNSAISGRSGLIMFRTYYRAGDTVSFEQMHGSMESALYNLVSAVQSTAKYSDGWEVLDVDSDLFGGNLSIVAPNSLDSGGWHMKWAFFYSVNDTPSALQKYVRAYFDGRVLEETVLREMFMCDQSELKRSSDSDLLLEMIPVADSNLRRLYRSSPYPNHSGQLLVLYAKAEDGARSWVDSLPISSDQVCLLLDQSTGFTVAAEIGYGESLSVKAVFSLADSELVSGMRTYVLPEVQKKGEEYQMAMARDAKTKWRSSVKELVRRHRSLV